MVIPWTEEEDEILETKLDHPELSMSEVLTALAAIGSRRTDRGVENRLIVLKKKREGPVSHWLTDPFLTGRSQ